MTAETLTSLDRRTLRERALNALRLAIISGQYRPGDHLGEVELAGRLGVSRGTVREALRHLQQEGLVTPSARGMLRVRSHSATEVRELFQVRAALEGLAVRLIIASPKRRAAVAALRGALADLNEQHGDFMAHVEADKAFHLLLCELSGNSMLATAWRQLAGRIRVTIMARGEGQAALMSGDYHAPIVDSIEAGDVNRAVEVLEQHMEAAAERLASG
ncbi:GntR family transcriptional regulator [Micromonospora endophytica]|uniref:GntR family transcriptional regulator n=1 Tax=Micromonospora endophytica TaxID=515350 RepID=A0A2W2DKL6_9ACTN|nr:GntR family transcriptional regulator [Micromonospora endophytica]PZG00268.1 GntR family transcriptional regulator [Micromonospora endophytica]RIW47392.1 GntR family transcriptional regulator [Micromonospora endophytica]BCJ60882.1 GntR family transcriptional regulator [Micromonospora endophytica]